MTDDFEDYSVNIDNDVLHQDFDDVDLYGNKLVEDEDNNFGNELEFE